MTCPNCGADRNFIVYPKSENLDIFTCFACGEDTPLEVKP